MATDGDAAAPGSEAPQPSDAEALGPREPGSPIGRRAFLGIVGVGLTSLAWGGAALNLVSKGTELLPQGIRAAVPFGSGWRIYAVNPPFPVFKPASWTLRIEGLVEHPMELTYQQLLGLPRAHQVTDFHCVTGWSVDNVGWTGVRFKDLLAAAKPLASGKVLEFWSAEQDYVDTLTLDQASLPDAMLAYGMDGKPITREHGAPARLVMPKMYGYKGVKWVSKIVVTDAVNPGYWEQRGYDTDAWIGASNGL